MWKGGDRGTKVQQLLWMNIKHKAEGVVGGRKDNNNNHHTKKTPTKPYFSDLERINAG